MIRLWISMITVGSAALVAAVSYRGKATQISRKEQRSTLKKIFLAKKQLMDAFQGLQK